MKHNIIYFISGVCFAGLMSCSPAGGEKRGHEFMPDMVHSTAYEANVYEYYYYNTWGTESEYMKYAMPRKSVPGTIARGNVKAAMSATPEERMMAHHAFTGEGSPNSIAMTENGAVPYPFKDTDADRVRAAQGMLVNPYPITEAGLARGSVLYMTYCGICHGAAADGIGYLVREEDPSKGISAGVYPAAPANFIKEAFLDTTDGFFYHAIMYGKNMMGSYADKLSYEERWQVIHYIRALQAKAKGLVYNEDENTYTKDIPGGPMLAEMQSRKEAMMSAHQEMPKDTTHQEEAGGHGEHH